MNTIKEKKVLLFLFDGVEETEAVVTIDLLRRAKIKVDLVTNKKSLKVVGAHNITLEARFCLDKIHNLKKVIDYYDGFILPGGKKQQESALDNLKTQEIFIKAHQNKKLVASICAGPLNFYYWKIIKDFNFSVFESLKLSEFNNQQRTTVNNNIITSISVGSVFEFTFAIIQKLTSKTQVLKIQDQIIYQS